MVLANEFYKSWLKIVKKNITDLQSAWDYPATYTKIIIKDDHSLIKQISKDLNLCCYNADFYSIDSVLYRKQDHLNQYPGIYLHNIAVAFEHENSFNKNLYQETSHLLITNAELKVLVTYPPDLLYENKSSDVYKQLDLLREIISSSPHAKDISDKENFLLILGKNDITGLDANSWNLNDYWKGFVYKNNDWKEIE